MFTVYSHLQFQCQRSSNSLDHKAKDRREHHLRAHPHRARTGRTGCPLQWMDSRTLNIRHIRTLSGRHTVSTLRASTTMDRRSRIQVTRSTVNIR